MEIIDAPQLPNYSHPVYAGFWLRFVAALIDGIVIGIVQWIIMLPILALFGISMFSLSQFADFSNMDESSQSGLISMMVSAYAAIIVTSTIIKWLYYALMESSSKQATLGKMAINLKVTDLQGNRITFLNATGRFFSKIISSMILMIGYIMAGFTEKKQALHDIIAGTLVVQKVQTISQMN